MGDLERSSERAGRLQTSAYQTARDRFSATMESAIERAERRRLEREKAKADAALAAQQAAAVERRDKKQNLYETGSINQRANIAANQAAMDNRYATERERMQQQGTLKRDEFQNQFTSQRDKQQALDQQRRDERQFGYSTQQAEQQQGNTLERDAFQNQYATQRDQTQFGQQLQRDFTQFGLDSRRQDQQQRNTLERDYMQGGIQAERDTRLNQYDTQRDVRQNQFQTERDVRQDRFQTQGDIRQQHFQQQNMTQRETAEVAAKWQEDVQRYRNAGMDFSPAQQKEMKEMETAFRRNVLNGDMDESTRQRAMLLYQKKLATFVPQDKVVKAEDEIGQQFFNHPELGLLKRSRDSQGNPDWQPLGTGGQDPQMKAQAQAEQKQAEALQKAEINRETEFSKVVDAMLNATHVVNGEPVQRYPEYKDAVEAARTQFAGRERAYRRQGLGPGAAYQDEIDQYKNAQQNPQGPPQTQANPYRSETMNSAAAAAQPPLMLPARGALPEPVKQQLLKMPGGNQLHTIREKYKSNSMEDQFIKQSADIVIKSMLTGNMDDPDLAEALDYLKEVGFNPGK